MPPYRTLDELSNFFGQQSRDVRQLLLKLGVPVGVVGNEEVADVSYLISPLPLKKRGNKRKTSIRGRWWSSTAHNLVKEMLKWGCRVVREQKKGRRHPNHVEITYPPSGKIQHLSFHHARVIYPGSCARFGRPVAKSDWRIFIVESLSPPFVLVLDDQEFQKTLAGRKYFPIQKGEFDQYLWDTHKVALQSALEVKT